MDFRSAGGWLRLVIGTTGGRAAVKSVAVSVWSRRADMLSMGTAWQACVCD